MTTGGFGALHHLVLRAAALSLCFGLPGVIPFPSRTPKSHLTNYSHPDSQDGYRRTRYVKTHTLQPFFLTVGGAFSRWTPTPPERGSFPLDHDGECKFEMEKYLQCMKFTANQNAPNCRALAKDYLKCRMDNDLMDQLTWDSLGLTHLPDTGSDRHKPKD